MALCTAVAMGVSVFSLQSGKWQALDMPNQFTMKLFDSGSPLLKFNTEHKVCQFVHTAGLVYCSRQRP